MRPRELFNRCALVIQPVGWSVRIPNEQASGRIALLRGETRQERVADIAARRNNLGTAGDVPQSLPAGMEPDSHERGESNEKKNGGLPTNPHRSVLRFQNWRLS
jgi:hypothetical protein